MTNEAYKLPTYEEYHAMNPFDRLCARNEARAHGFDPSRVFRKPHEHQVISTKTEKGQRTISSIQAYVLDCKMKGIVPFSGAKSTLPLNKQIEFAARRAQAEANEMKYGGLGMTVTERITEKYQASVPRRYARLEEGVGTNGDCHSRKSTYRHHKYGSGNIKRSTWLARGFPENEHK